MRIQILELPTVPDGDDYRTPFALIIDQVDVEEITTLGGEAVRSEHPEMAGVSRLAEQVGASGVLLTGETVEVV